MDLSLIAKVTVVLAIGLGATALARHARASVRHLMLASTFAALVLVPAVSWLVPIQVAVQTPRIALATVVPDVHVRERIRVVTDTTRTDAGSAPIVTVTSVLYATWVTGVVVLMTTFLGSLIRLRRLRRDAIPWADGQRRLKVVSQKASVSVPVDVLCHESLGAPVTWGIRHPVILMPPEADTWEAQDLTQAFLHELEHVHRKDWITQVIARSLCAIYWFHPLVWLAWRQLCLESERACDDAVVAHAEAPAYAQQLVMLAHRVTTAETVPLLSMAGRSDLSVRVKALLNATLQRGRAGRPAVAVSVVVATLAVAALSPLRATTAAADVAVEEQQQQPRRPPNQSVVATALADDLIESAGRGDIRTVSELIAGGADVNAVVEGDGSPLIAAARSNQLPIVKLLVEQGANVNLAVPGDGNPLIGASARGAREVVQYLIDRGADIEAMVPGDENPLINASAQGHLDIVRLLVARGANFNAGISVNNQVERNGIWSTIPEYRSPLSMAIKFGHRAVAEFLRANGAIN